MDQPAPRKAPYFDLDLLRHEASELARAYSGKDSTLRKALVDRMRLLVEDARAAARRQLEEDGDGRACAAGLSAFQDALIKLAYDFTTTHVYPSDNPSAAERMEIVGSPDELPDVQKEVQTVIDKAEGKHWPLKSIERFAFYEKAKKAYCVIQTGERRFYGCFVLTKGVIPPDAK